MNLIPIYCDDTPMIFHFIAVFAEMIQPDNKERIAGILILPIKMI